MTIKQLRERSNSFVANFDLHVAEVVNFNEDLEQLNRDQLKDNRLADDKPITPPYNPLYADYKRTFYPASYGDGRVNLFLTGELYRRLEIRTRGNEYLITTDVPYALKLARKYGDYTGIAPSNQGKAQRIISALLGEKYEKLVLS